jgi:glycosyltransferase involved in cell wall biosynthesis
MSNRRILIISPQPFFQERGTPIAIRHVIDALLELGWSVDLVTYPIGLTIDRDRLRYFRGGNPLHFDSIGIGPSFRKIVLDLAIMPTLRRRMRDEYALIHAVEEGAFLVQLMNGHVDTPLLYDMQSSIPEQLRTVPGLGNRLAQWLLRGVERWMIDRSTVVVTSRGLASRVTTRPVAEWSFPSTELEIASERTAARRAALGLGPDDPTVVYTGSLAPYQGLARLVGAIPGVLERFPRARFLIVGGSASESAGIRRQAERLGVTDACVFLTRQPEPVVEECMALADVLVSPREFGDNLPLKIFNYIAAGRPIVATDIPCHRTVLDERMAVLTPATEAGLAEGICSVLGETDRGMSLAAAARELTADQLSWAGFVKRVDEVVTSALGTD